MIVLMQDSKTADRDITQEVTWKTTCNLCLSKGLAKAEYRNEHAEIKAMFTFK